MRLWFVRDWKAVMIANNHRIFLRVINNFTAKCKQTYLVFGNIIMANFIVKLSSAFFDLEKDRITVLCCPITFGQNYKGYRRIIEFGI